MDIIFLPTMLDDGVSTSEIELRYSDAYAAFEGLKKKYTTGIRQYLPWMTGKDKEFLKDTARNLLRFSMQKPVFSEVGYATTEDTLWYKVNWLAEEMLDMLASYPNTGIQPLYTDSFWDKT